MIERRREIRSLNHQKQHWARQLFLFERNRLLSQLEGLRTFESAQTENFASAQRDYFGLLEETDYNENTGILGPLTILLKLEEVVATMTAEYQWCRNVLTNAGVDIDSEESIDGEEINDWEDINDGDESDDGEEYEEHEILS